MTFRVGVVQCRPRLLHPAANARACLELMDRRAADLWVLPELVTSGYNFRDRREARRCAEPVAGGSLCGLLRAYAVLRGCAVVAGFPEKAGGRLYNSAALITARGVRLYRKTHLFGRERRFFSPGDTGFKVWPVQGVPVGVMICFDWFFPEACRSLALKGAWLVAHPSNMVLPWGPEAMRLRSLENRVFSATADRVGVERGMRFIGRSQIVAPDGEILARAGEREVCALVASVDPSRARDKRLASGNDAWRDRRPRLYLRALSRARRPAKPKTSCLQVLPVSR